MLATRDSRPWEVAFLIVVLLVIVLLNAVRYTLMSREARHLSLELAAMAEERRPLLANMVRALEHDRHRTVAEPTPRRWAAGRCRPWSRACP